ncbi:ankyrin repeat-containing domain protein [Diaporthe sp. PMI_573]|nr:ankyrin repeat-containing domain protein [Diaporthaceae sp. PMI_573]
MQADPNELAMTSFGQVDALSVGWFIQFRDHLPILRVLLEYGADPNRPMECILPAFFTWCLKYPSLEVIELMLQHGADLNMVEKTFHQNILHIFASKGEDVKALELLLNHPTNGINGPKLDINAVTKKSGGSQTPLSVLLRREGVPRALVRAFLQNGADVNAEFADSERPLQLASVLGDCEVLKILCERKIEDVDDGNTDGDTALHFAANRGHVECVEVLLEEGASVNLPDGQNRTPLYAACCSETTKSANRILDELIKRKLPISEINMISRDEETPLNRAALQGHGHIVERLLHAAKSESDKASLVIDLANALLKQTPLHNASKNGHKDCVRLLLDAKANILTSTKLHDLGANLSLPDKYGWTPLELARKFRHEAAMNFLAH